MKNRREKKRRDVEKIHKNLKITNRKTTNEKKEKNSPIWLNYTIKTKQENNSLQKRD